MIEKISIIAKASWLLAKQCWIPLNIVYVNLPRKIRRKK